MFYIHQQTQVQHLRIGLYIEFEHITTDEVQHDPDVQDDKTEAYEGMNNDSDEEFEATCKPGDEDEDGDEGGVADLEDEKFRIGMAYGSRKSVIASIQIAQDGNQNIVPITFAIVEGDQTADAWHFFLSNLQSHDVRRDDVGIISDRHESIRAAVNRSGGDWKPPRAWWIFCIRHIGSNFLREFKVPYLQKLVVNIRYSRMVKEYNVNYKRLQELGEAYARWCDNIVLPQWVLAFDEGHRWSHMTTNLVECINSMLNSAQNLPVLVLI
ncbi:hypothetical protein AHAS_Ahas13G0339400 [Arachis hypogaea]